MLAAVIAANSMGGATMREDRAPKPRPPRMLTPVHTPIPDAFDLADVVITVDGEEVRLGDYWTQAFVEAAFSRRGDE